MLNMSFAELLVILVFAFLVLGPNEMSKVARFLGRALRKSGQYMDQIKKYVNDEAKEAGVDDVKKTVSEVKTEVEDVADPLKDVKTEIDRDQKIAEQLKKLK